jgi:transcription elongation factor GreA
VETRILEIEDILQNAEIIKSSGTSSVGLGSTVELQCPERTVSYTVVGPVEADPLAGRISDQSPIGKELIGKKIGDEVTIKTPQSILTASQTLQIIIIITCSRRIRQIIL